VLGNLLKCHKSYLSRCIGDGWPQSRMESP
jgi:hypothetical protein